MKTNRRQHLKNIIGTSVLANRWVSPVILSAALPAHAQTSFCSPADITGVWDITITSGTLSDFQIDFDVEEVRDGGPGELLFELVPVVFSVRETGGGCTTMSGDYSDAIGASGPDFEETSGTFIGEKT